MSDLICFHEKLNKYRQCSKFRFYLAHTPGAHVAKIVHPAVCLCDLPYIKVLIY